MKLHIVVDLDSDALAGATEGNHTAARELRNILAQVARQVTDRDMEGGGVKDFNGNFAADFFLNYLEAGDKIELPNGDEAQFTGIYGTATREGRAIQTDPRMIRLDWLKVRGE